MPVRYYKYDKPFVLENGERFPELQIAYHTYGKFKGNNAIWVCHALTANSDVADWWPRTVEQGRFLDPRRYYVVCANVIGSHYGSTGPLSLNPATGKPYYGSFPFITVRDMVNAHLLLADHLGVGSVRAVIGSSIDEPEGWSLAETVGFSAFALVFAVFGVFLIFLVRRRLVVEGGVFSYLPTFGRSRAFRLADIAGMTIGTNGRRLVGQDGRTLARFEDNQENSAILLQYLSEHGVGLLVK